MKHRYLYANERGFRNEFTIYRVPEDKVAEAEEWIEHVTHRRFHTDNYHDVRWVTRREAERLLRRERAQARENLAWTDLHQNPVGATEFTPWESPRVEEL